jgi:diguanylate cyclase (GGDEF)-like protein
VVAPVSVAGVAAYAAATLVFLTSSPSAETILGVAALLAASTLAERYPVPLEGADLNGVSIGFVFAVAALVLFGWAPGTFVYATAPTIVALIERRPPIRVVFNAGVFGLVGSVAGVLLETIGGSSTRDVLVQVAVTSGTLYGLNLLLIAAAVAASGSEHRYARLVRSTARGTVLPFALMTSTALVLVVLWQRSPLLSAALVGPLIAISLYQRSTHRALRAMRLALTDPLTGLGNHRHFHERLQRELTAAETAGSPVSLCLLDIDDFKQINDRHGHPAGDDVLSQVAGRLRHGGEAFRLGGDEFAILMVGLTERQALEAAHSIVARIGRLDLGHVGRITISAGVATHLEHGSDRDSLVRLADGALYAAKERGKNLVLTPRPEPVADGVVRDVAAPAQLPLA